MDTRILDVSVTHGRKFFAQICAMLVFDIFNDGIPAVSVCTQLRKKLITKEIWHVPSLVVDLVAVTGSVDDIQSKPNTILNDD